MSQADLQDISVLMEMRSSLLRFGETSRNIPERLRVRAERADEALRARCRALKDEIRQLENQVAQDDEDDERSTASSERDELRERLSELEGCRARLTRAVDKHEQGRLHWQSVTDHVLPAAAAYLSQRHAQALDYLGTYLSSQSPNSASPATPAVRSLAAKAEGAETSGAIDAADPRTATAAAQLPDVPDGFSWTPIDQISDLPERTDFRKGVSYDDMAAGLQRLWQELIPLVRSSPGNGRKVCEAFDRQHGRFDPRGFVHPESLAELWGHFFEQRSSKNYIRIEIDADGKSSVTNGRHRILVALDLGWKFIPAVVVDQRSRG